MAQMRFRLQQGAIPHGRGYSAGRYHFTYSCEHDTGRTANFACREVSQEICKQENDLLSQSTSCTLCGWFYHHRQKQGSSGRNQAVSSGLSQRKGINPVGRENKDYTHWWRIWFSWVQYPKIQRSASNQTVQKEPEEIHAENPGNHWFQ